MSSNYDNIINILNYLKIEYKEITHEASHTCDESKEFRNQAGLSGIGSKNIVFHCKGNYYLVTTHGDKNIKARNFKGEFGSKDIRFANQEEITKEIDSIIGSVPPFGFENNLIPIYVDSEIFDNEYFIFNPSVTTKSIQVKTADLRKIYENLQNPIKFFNHSEDSFELLNLN